ncbi:MAG: Phosphoenolpyruvate carboxykinase [Bryobacterales bacterium]|nr:Phosphoenolpyruvate carboxykinase [Bryobacterales bacterium]
MPAEYSHGLDLTNARSDLGAEQLIEHSIQRREGLLADNGALVVRTGQFTGRSPKDKFIVRDELTESTVNWGPVNQPISPERFDNILVKAIASLKGEELFVQNCLAGADPEYSLPVRVITQFAWHALFAKRLLIRPPEIGATGAPSEFTLLFAPEFRPNPAVDGTRSDTCIILNFKRRMVLIAGTSYAGELKKSVFTVLNHLLPARGVFPMHCSANMDPDGKVALFFGLSGTGKTTLSTDPHRFLIGDDEHGWSDRGVFNFEGGCYAKCIRLSREQEPQIWNAIRFGTVLENVAMDPRTRRLDFNSDEITENTRAAYPLEFIENAVLPSVGGHPRHVIFLTADAFGVLPPISHLTPEQAMYHFLSGYTAKVAGTERGLGKEPEATFSACFAQPFLTRPPGIYAGMLGEKIRQHEVSCWLVNTGWVGGPYGVGQRMKLSYTRAMLNAALSGELENVPMTPHPVFRVMVPKTCPNVPAEMLDARGMWRDKAAYDRAAAELSARFNRNFEKFTLGGREVLEAAPVG